MQILQIISIVFLFTTSLFSQSFRGRVVDSRTNEPLKSANVLILTEKIGTAADKEGTFSIDVSSISNDQFEVRFSFLGYESKFLKLDRLNLKDFYLIRLDETILSSQTVLVTSTLGREGLSPITFSNMSKEEIKNRYSIQDFPQFLSEFPSTTSYSESGNGIGYNYINIRGFDQRRISVTINGIPQNDPEDHNVYWHDFPDLIESANNIQLQRGVSSNLIGSPAIGGSINIITSTFSREKEILIKSGFGSYNTRKLMASFSSGLIDDQYAVYGRLSQILSSGYRENAWVNLFSYFFSAIRFDENSTNQLNVFGGPIEDGLTYTGLPKFAIYDKDQRRKNYSDWGQVGNSYSYTVNRRRVEIENFSQPHIELLSEYRFNDNLILNSALFGYWGKGFFDYDASWGDTSYFRLTYANGFAPTSNLSNALVRAYVDNKHFGWIPRISFNTDFGNFIFGFEFRKHNSLHWGSVWYAVGLPAGADQNWRYYEYKGAKDVLGGFIYYRKDLLHQLTLTLENQIVYNKTRLHDEKFVNTDFTIKNAFVNPKAGLIFKLHDNFSFYGYYAVVSREPRLKNYYDAAESSGGATPQFEVNVDGNYNFSKPVVKNETLQNFELGTHLDFEQLRVNLNLYLMSFRDEIVKKGQLDRFGQPVTGNADRTTHLGAEMTLNYNILQKIFFSANFSISQNKINEGKTYIKYKDPTTKKKLIKEIDLSENKISNFPDMIANFRLSYKTDNIFASISGNYVGKQFTDNFDNKLKRLLALYPNFVEYNDNVVPDYFVANFDFRYTFHEVGFINELTLFGRVNNLFNRIYATYGIGKEFFPAAERDFFGGIEIRL
jgi:iron complex outermembrane receptor protein